VNRENPAGSPRSRKIIWWPGHSPRSRRMWSPYLALPPSTEPATRTCRQCNLSFFAPLQFQS
jgi:hypothetical protein